MYFLAILLIIMFQSNANLNTILYTFHQDLNYLLKQLSEKQTPSITFETLVKNSHDFNENQGQFTTQNNRISVIAGDDQIKQNTIAQQAMGTHPIVHSKVLELIKNFIAHKKQFGSAIEQKFYKNMNEYSLIDRLLINRPLQFMTSSDAYLLRGKQADPARRGSGGFEAIGTKYEKQPLTLQNYISYDEMQLAALLGVSTPTYFINNGNRNNQAEKAPEGTFISTGIYVGLVGARFEKPGHMEWQHMIITPVQNTTANGYGSHASYTSAKADLLRIWSEFYGEQFFTYEQAKQDTSDRFIKLNGIELFDTAIYKKRLAVVIEPFLFDANQRGKEQNKKVYLHIVGLGLGVWQVSPLQAKYMLEVYEELLTKHHLPFISDINFSWFPAEYQKMGNYTDGSTITKANNSIKVHFSKRNPADLLNSQDSDKLLVAQYAWDGNAHPGNEYWTGALTASGDPAAACCSTITELQNPLINPHVSSKDLKIFG